MNKSSHKQKLQLKDHKQETYYNNSKCNATPIVMYTIHSQRVDSYCQTSNVSHTLRGNKTVDQSDVVGASPVGAAPTTSSFSI